MVKQFLVSLKYKVEEATSPVLEEFYVRWKGSTFVSLFLHVLR